MLRCQVDGGLVPPGARECPKCKADEKSLKPVYLSLATAGVKCRVAPGELPFHCHREWLKLHFGSVRAADGSGNLAYEYLPRPLGAGAPVCMFTIAAGTSGFEFTSEIDPERNHFRLDGEPLRREPKVVTKAGGRVELWASKAGRVVLALDVGFDTFG